MSGARDRGRARSHARSAAPEPIRWDGERLELLDQTLLPTRVEYTTIRDLDAICDAIRTLKVRGAPAIGIAAAYGVVTALASHRAAPRARFVAAFEDACAAIAATRPTAVNLAGALARQRACIARCEAATADSLWQALRDEAQAIHREDREICRAIARNGLPLIRPGCGVLTHCNAGALAVSELGTATAPLYLAHERGVAFRVYVDETRPVLQGSRLTAWELSRAGLDVTLICDNAAARLMDEGLIDLVLVGTDRVVRNGDVVNKIGTSALAILCAHYRIPFYVACPSSTIDLATATGRDVAIEERDMDEVRAFRGRRAAPRDVKARNPAFDVTPSTLVTALITDRGVIEPPLADNLADTFRAS